MYNNIADIIKNYKQMIRHHQNIQPKSYNTIYELNKYELIKDESDIHNELLFKNMKILFELQRGHYLIISNII